MEREIKFRGVKIVGEEKGCARHPFFVYKAHESPNQGTEFVPLEVKNNCKIT
jgi:hypothetical protein